MREAPSVRSVANSRVRWATVIDSVLKITNAPTSSAMPAKPSSTLRIMPMPSLTSAASSFACLALSLTSRLPGTICLTASTSSVADVPGFAAIETLSKRPSRPSSFCAVSTSQAAMLAKPSESTPPNVTVPASS